VPRFFLVLAAVIELVCGALILIGYRTDIASLVFFAYLVPVTLVFRNFWNLHGIDAQIQLVKFLKNLSFVGGLLGLAAASPTA
jgi:putative oxidoreductase